MKGHSEPEDTLKNKETEGSAVENSKCLVDQLIKNK